MAPLDIVRSGPPDITIDTTAAQSSQVPSSFTLDGSVSSLTREPASIPTESHGAQKPRCLPSPTGPESFLSVPSAHTRQPSVDSFAGNSQGDTLTTSSSIRPPVPKAGAHGDKIPTSEEVMNDRNALRPDKGKEAAFEVADNPFAFSAGQLGKFFNPKSLSAFWMVGGLAGLEKGLQTDRNSGLRMDEVHVGRRVAFDEVANHPGVVKERDASLTPAATDVAPNHGASTAGVDGSGNESFVDRKRVFSDNRLPDRKGKSLLQLIWITLNDKVLILLSIAAAVSLAVGLYRTFGIKRSNGEPSVDWIEGVAIIAAILIVVVVGSLNDYQKERQFAKLNKRKQDREVKVIRSGKMQKISVYDIVVGDVLHLEPGDKIPVDGILINGFDIKCDESQATGESDAIFKTPADNVYDAIKTGRTLKKMDPFIQSGATVHEGVGTFLVTATGIHSTYGATLMGLNEDPEMTPLQSKLNAIATYIAKIGSAVGLLLFTVLLIKFLASLDPQQTAVQKGQTFLGIFIVVVTIIVVVVPEGLPLAVTLALAFATTRMLKDNNLVRHLKACEVMGNATAVCSDKTGTLTQNKMQVVAGTVSTEYRVGSENTNDLPEAEKADLHSVGRIASTLSPALKRLLVSSIALNSTAFEGEVDGATDFIGSKTETALLHFARQFLGMGPVAEERHNADIVQLFSFDSGRKCMGVAVRLADGRVRFFVKGASEILLAHCSGIVEEASNDLHVSNMAPADHQALEKLIENYAKKSLRTIGIVYRDFESWPPQGYRTTENNEIVFEDVFKQMVFIALVGIQDPLRPGVPEAVAACQNAGVTVRMVTGDNRITAEAIAKECGIFKPGCVVMEGPEFRNLSKHMQYEIIPRLAVLARSSPEDKRILVSRLKAKDEIVAVTGDGTNDAPALAKADVGFSMGIAGTEVAKEASSIILMDDNFVSIVKALKWGRAVNDAVKRFLQFQLTVNLTAVVLTFVSAVTSADEESVLKAVQLLWVNLIMDTLAALALATDPPHDSVLNRLPEKRNAPIITTTMWKMIIGQAIYQLAVTLTLYFGGYDILNYDSQHEEVRLNTLVFNTFVWMQIFNQWNNRRLDNGFNIFQGLSKNPFFLLINGLMCGAQVIIIFFGGRAFSISREGQHGVEWGIALLLGFISIPIGMLIRLVPDSLVERLVPEFVKRRRHRKELPVFEVDDEDNAWITSHPLPFVEVRDDLVFLRKFKGGRLANLKFAVQHPREYITKARTLSPSGSLNSQTPRMQSHDGRNGVSGGTPGSTRQDPRAAATTTTTTTTAAETMAARSARSRSRSSSKVGAPTVMAGIIAAGVATGAAWSPTEASADFPSRFALSPMAEQQHQ